MAGRWRDGQACSMTMKPNMQQRDLVRLAVLMCGDRTGAKYQAPAKGTSNARSGGAWKGSHR
jgi:hypothetical protein